KCLSLCEGASVLTLDFASLTSPVRCLARQGTSLGKRHWTVVENHPSSVVVCLAYARYQWRIRCGSHEQRGRSQNEGGSQWHGGTPHRSTRESPARRPDIGRGERGGHRRLCSM